MDDPLFLTPLVTGSIVLVVSLIMRIYPPKEVNVFYGYRTPRSMKSKESWEFAQNYFSKVLLICSALLTASCSMGIWIDLQVGLAICIALVLVLMCCLLPILLTEI